MFMLNIFSPHNQGWLISPSLETLDTTQHIQVTSRVLLNHIFHIIRSKRLLKLLLGHMEFHYPVNSETTNKTQLAFDNKLCHTGICSKGKEEYCTRFFLIRGLNIFKMCLFKIQINKYLRYIFIKCILN